MSIHTFSDFCAGIGGFRLAMESLGMTCSFTAEFNEDAVRTYNKNFKDFVKVIDITEIDVESLPDFDLMCAGFPCQPFSIAGKRLGLLDDRSGVLPKLIEIIKYKKPKIILLENVKNFENFGGGSLLNETKSSIADIGYSVFHSVLDAARFGLPQFRKRIFILAISNEYEVKDFIFPAGSSKQVSFRDYLMHDDKTIPITQRWEEYIDFYTGIKKQSDLSFTPPKTRVSLERADNNLDLQDCVFQIRSSGIRAVSIDKPLPTFAVSISGGGAMIPVYSKERRHLNLIEIKRIMGFPDSFEFPVSRTSAIKQLANAVCPQVVQSVMSSVLYRIENKRNKPRVNDEERGQLYLPL